MRAVLSAVKMASFVNLLLPRPEKKIQFEVFALKLIFQLFYFLIFVFVFNKFLIWSYLKYTSQKY